MLNFIIIIIIVIFIEAFSRILSLWGRLDIVCNNAAVLDEDDWNKTLNTNLVSLIVLFIAAFPLQSTNSIYPSAMSHTISLFSQSNNCVVVNLLKLSLPQPILRHFTEVVKASKINKHFLCKPMTTCRKRLGAELSMNYLNSIRFQYTSLHFF